MSKQQYASHIDNELHRLNEIIDFKILHGVVYNDEAKRHRQLLIQAARIQNRKFSNFFGHLFFGNMSKSNV